MNGLDHWPEPIVRVQSLSESGTSVIPEKYIKPPSERPVLNSNDADDMAIPIIDLKGLEGDMNCLSTITMISQACKEWGFFQVVNHGMSSEIIKRMMDVWRSFFHLPMEQKQIYANSPKVHEGYGTRFGYAKDAIYDWQDYYFLEIYPKSTRNLDKWPSLPTSCKETVEEYSAEMMALSQKLMKAMSVGIGLEADCLLKAFGGDEAGASMRVNYYSKCPQPGLTLGISAHSDPGGMAVLLADHHVKGLQVRKGDKWVTVQPVPNAFVVNIGDQIQVLTNGAYKSVEHRAIVNSEDGRLSVAFFYNPENDVPIRPIGELVSPDQPPLYRDTTFYKYREYVRSMGLGGKSYVDSLKAWNNERIHAAKHWEVMGGNKERFSCGFFALPSDKVIIEAPQELVDEEHSQKFKPFTRADLFRYISDHGKHDALQKYAGI